jgi:intracellular septation protein A
MSDKQGIAGLASQLGGSSNGKHPLWNAMGGALGIVETILPGLLFVLVFTFTLDPWLAMWISVSASVLFTLYRLIRRQAATQALVGLVGVVISAVLALMSNKPEDNFVVGMVTNGVYGTVFLVSVLVGWPIIGVVIGLVRNEGTSWRKNRHHKRVYTGVTTLWVGMFALRLAVELPLYFSGNVAGLATAKLILGLPLYVPVLALTWLIVRSLYREKSSISHN